MQASAMREALKGVVKTVPRSNKDVEKLYSEKFSETEFNPPVNLHKAAVYTYIGGGHEPPQIVNFLERQVFRLGDPTEVTDPLVLSKIATNPTFRLGVVSAEEILEMEAKAQKRVDDINEENVKIQIMADRANK